MNDDSRLERFEATVLVHLDAAYNYVALARGRPCARRGRGAGGLR